ncbi:hypothetical protein B6S09_07220 [Oceanimonas baumannii]|uniref:Uncharacterized protein n=1 Tax=Oceanimonas baumannii TaxID=129578 RepID=A0A235CKB7_9GAMM|nr:hypothetical protein B6S09_07220 [Oceanimonas baumannii]
MTGEGAGAADGAKATGDGVVVFGGRGRRRLCWAPAFAGATRKGVGATRKGAGTTTKHDRDKKAGQLAGFCT